MAQWVVVEMVPQFRIHILFKILVGFTIKGAPITIPRLVVSRRWEGVKRQFKNSVND